MSLITIYIIKLIKTIESRTMTEDDFIKSARSQTTATETV